MLSPMRHPYSWLAKRELNFAVRLFLVGPQSGRKLEQGSGRIVKGGTLRAEALRSS